MRGITTIDRQPGSDTIAMWVTSASQPLQARHVNAVVIEAGIDPRAMGKVRSLTRCCGVLVTDGSNLDGLPVEGAPLNTTDIADLVAQTEEQQEAIAQAVRDYKRRTRSTSLKLPTFPSRANAGDFVPAEDSPSARAFAAANYLARAWTTWLQTDEERRRRTARPKTGETPWIMPESMNSPQVAILPGSFAERMHEQALV